MSTRRFTFRHVEFIGAESYPQGYGMTWDSVNAEVDLEPNETIIEMKAHTRSGGGFDGLCPAITIWIAQEHK